MSGIFHHFSSFHFILSNFGVSGGETEFFVWHVQGCARGRLLNSISAALCAGRSRRKAGLVRRSPTAVIHMATLSITH